MFYNKLFFLFNKMAWYTKCTFYYYDTKIFGMCTIKYLNYTV